MFSEDGMLDGTDERKAKIRESNAMGWTNE